MRVTRRLWKNETFLWEQRWADKARPEIIGPCSTMS